MKSYKPGVSIHNLELSKSNFGYHNNKAGGNGPAKRADSPDNIGEEVEEEMHEVRGRHILASGKDFQFGKDRPSSNASSDNGS